MDWRKITRAFLVGVVSVVVGYDVLAVMRGGIFATVSWQLYTWAKDEPISAFALGVVFGHILWPNRPPEEKRQ
jgi:cytochrome c biogenesis protein CcdA